MYNQKIEPNTLPSTLTHLKFGHFYNQKIEPGTLPPNLIYLEFGTLYDQKIEPNTLPSSVQQVILGDHMQEHLFDDIYKHLIKIE